MRYQVKSPVNGQLRRYELAYVGERNAQKVNDAIEAARRGRSLVLGRFLNDLEVVDRVQQILYRDADSMMGCGHHDPYGFGCGDVLSAIEHALRSIKEEKESIKSA